jgi:hypothetical protein
LSPDLALQGNFEPGLPSLHLTIPHPKPETEKTFFKRNISLNPVDTSIKRK